jgi:predicted ATPase
LREKHGDQYRQIVGAIRMVAPFFRDFQLRPYPLNEQKIQLEWSEAGSDAYFNAHSLSDGTLRFMCLATLLLQPSPPSTIVIDEPELGLHPFAIQVLASLVQSASLRTQVIVSTQSVTLVNHFMPGDVIVVDREGGQSTFARLSEQSMSTWLEDYGLGDLWEKNVLGGRPK